MEKCPFVIKDLQIVSLVLYVFVFNCVYVSRCLWLFIVQCWLVNYLRAISHCICLICLFCCVSVNVSMMFFYKKNSKKYKIKIQSCFLFFKSLLSGCYGYLCVLFYQTQSVSKCVKMLKILLFRCIWC